MTQGPSGVKKIRVILKRPKSCATALSAALMLLCTSSCTTEIQRQTIYSATSEQAQFLEMMQKSFQAKGQAGLERLEQDPTQQFCSEQGAKRSAAIKDQASQSSLTDSSERASSLLLENLNRISQPSDANYFGDYKRGELIAQDGRGKTWSDPPQSPSGGNCYNCHRLSKTELSYGTLGPSLYLYGRLRGIRTQADFVEKSLNAKNDPLIQRTWGMLMNAKAFDLCSAMPRFGVGVVGGDVNQKIHGVAVLNESQIKDLMALLLNPQSLVNQE